MSKKWFFGWDPTNGDGPDFPFAFLAGESVVLVFTGMYHERNIGFFEWALERVLELPEWVDGELFGLSDDPMVLAEVPDDVFAGLFNEQMFDLSLLDKFDGLPVFQYLWRQPTVEEYAGMVHSDWGGYHGPDSVVPVWPWEAGHVNQGHLSELGIESMPVLAGRGWRPKS